MEGTMQAWVKRANLSNTLCSITMIHHSQYLSLHSIVFYNQYGTNRQAVTIGITTNNTKIYNENQGKIQLKYIVHVYKKSSKSHNLTFIFTPTQWKFKFIYRIIVYLSVIVTPTKWATREISEDITTVLIEPSNFSGWGVGVSW